LAIASLVLGILGPITCGLTGIVGLILGIIALGPTCANPPLLRGKGFAIAGIVVSSLTALVSIGALMTGLLLPALAKSRENALHLKSMAQLRLVAQAHQSYAIANDDSFAPVESWDRAVASYSSLPLSSTGIWAGAAAQERSFAMNAGLAGKTMSEIHAPFSTVLMFEVLAGDPIFGSRELIPSAPHHRAGYTVAFVDGTVRIVPPREMDQLVWDP
jgi:hypothetical protein